MTATITSNLLPAVRQFVYTRRRAAGGLPLINGETSGWTFDENLICEQIDYTDGPQVGTARFRLEPRDATKFRIDFGLAAYHIDDQVQVRAFPPQSELIQQAPDQGAVLFEGYLPRQSFSITNNEQQASEGVTFTAKAMPALDNLLSEHLIRGRWMFDRKTATEAAGNETFVSLSPFMPAVFNADGKPNMGQQKIARQIAETMISAPAFTHDADPTGQFWTVRAALASIIIQWIYKSQFRIDSEGTQHVVSTATADLNRNVCLDPELIVELAKAADAVGTTDALKDLGAQIPEVNVHGLGVLDAIKQVCDAAGFMFACELVQTLNEALGVDRRYQLRVWKRRRGRAVTIDLAVPGTAFADASSLFRNNNVHSVAGLISGDAVVNEVTAVGDTYIEGRITLKPGWSPDEVDTTDVATGKLQSLQEALLQGSGYHAKHVTGGRLFKDYFHVGRGWMVDCVGDPFLDQGSGFEGYSSGIYKHDDEGFDFVTALGLNATGDNPLISERTSLGFPGIIRWSNEPRRILPLRNPDSQAVGQDWIVEVSEDGGSTWEICPVHVSPLERQFGFKLVGIRNLASVNNATLSLRLAKCKVTESWWALIQNELLQFRITCSIRSDHGAAAKAERQTSSASAYRRGQLEILRGVEEVWQQPGTLLNPTSGVWRKVRGWSVVGAGSGDSFSYRTQLSDYATQRRNALEGRRLSMNATLYLLEFHRYRLGDAVTKMAGRELSFASSSAGGTNYPNVVGISMTLWPNDQQGLRLVMEDHAMEGAR